MIVYCSFCDRGSNEVGVLVRRVATDMCICKECIKECNKEISTGMRIHDKIKIEEVK